MRLKSAQDWIRTSTSLRTLRPEHSASTNFATWAGECFRAANIIVQNRLGKPFLQGEQAAPTKVAVIHSPQHFKRAIFINDACIICCNKSAAISVGKINNV